MNEAVKRNLKRFEGDDFMFRLTMDETDYARSRSQIATLNDVGSTDPSSLRSQFATSNNRGGNRYLPFAFTRKGIAMLSGLLRSEIAVKANINIMRAFFQMQEALMIVGNTQLLIEQIRSEIMQLR